MQLHTSRDSTGFIDRLSPRLMYVCPFLASPHFRLGLHFAYSVVPSLCQPLYFLPESRDWRLRAAKSPEKIFAGPLQQFSPHLTFTSFCLLTPSSSHLNSSSQLSERTYYFIPPILYSTHLYPYLLFCCNFFTLPTHLRNPKPNLIEIYDVTNNSRLNLDSIIHHGR